MDINSGTIKIAQKNIDFESGNAIGIYVKEGSATNLEFIKDESIDLICTHPPYADVIKYSKDIEGDISLVSVEEFSAAEKAGIKAGDLIVAFDGEDVTTMDKLNELKNKHNIGDEVKIKLIRNGEEKEVSITLGENKSTNEQ